MQRSSDHDDLRGTGGVRLHSLQQAEERHERETMNLKMEVAHLRERLHMRVGGETNAIELEAENFTLKRSLLDTQHALVEHQDALREMDAKYGKAMLNLVKLDQAWKASVEDNKRAQQHAAEADDRAQQLQHALDAFRDDRLAEVDAADAQLAHVIRERDELAQQANDSNRIDELQRLLDDAVAQSATLKHALTALQHEHTALQAQASAAATQAQTQTQALEAALAAAQQQQQQAAQRADTALQQQLRTCAQLQQQCDTAAQQMRVARTQATALQQFRRDVAQLLCTDASTSDRIDQSDASLCQQLVSALADARTAAATLTTTTQRVVQLERDLVNADALAVENATLRQTNERLVTQLRALKSEKQRSVKHMEDAPPRAAASPKRPTSATPRVSTPPTAARRSTVVRSPTRPTRPTVAAAGATPSSTLLSAPSGSLLNTATLRSSSSPPPGLFQQSTPSLPSPSTASSFLATLMREAGSSKRSTNAIQRASTTLSTPTHRPAAAAVASTLLSAPSNSSPTAAVATLRRSPLPLPPGPFEQPATTIASSLTSAGVFRAAVAAAAASSSTASASTAMTPSPASQWFARASRLPPTTMSLNATASTASTTSTASSPLSLKQPPPAKAVGGKRPLEERVELLRLRAKRNRRDAASSASSSSTTATTTTSTTDAAQPATTTSDTTNVATTRVKLKRVFVASRYLPTATTATRRSDL